jgi:DsbC/DsbD-like thiol-disulfide interchange protein
MRFLSMPDRHTVAALVIAVLAAPAPANAAKELATPWVETPSARVRLLAGGATARPGAPIAAGIEISLAEGWKTYWRTPGEAGVPPSFDWSGSGNTASIKVSYPAPMRLIDPAAEMIGYKKSVLFPIEIEPLTPSQAVDLRLALEFAVCREICIPAQASLQLTLPPGLAQGAPPAQITAARERVPRAQEARRGGDPSVTRVEAKLSGPVPSLEIDAKFPAGAAGADLFIEAPDGLFVPMAQKLPGGSDGSVRFQVDLSRAGSAEELRGKKLILTLVSEAGASEVAWTLD